MIEVSDTRRGESPKEHEKYLNIKLGVGYRGKVGGVEIVYFVGSILYTTAGTQ